VITSHPAGGCLEIGLLSWLLVGANRVQRLPRGKPPFRYPEGTSGGAARPAFPITPTCTSALFVTSRLGRVRRLILLNTLWCPGVALLLLLFLSPYFVYKKAAKKQALTAYHANSMPVLSQSAGRILSSLLARGSASSAATTQLANGTEANVVNVVCAWPVSGQYGPGSRILYYVLVVASVLGRQTDWLKDACLAAALLLPAVAAIHAIVLAALHVDGEYTKATCRVSHSC